MFLLRLLQGLSYTLLIFFCAAEQWEESGGHFDERFASLELRDTLEKKKHETSSLVHLLHIGTLTEQSEEVSHFREVDKRAFVEGATEHTESDPPVYVKEVGDVHVSSGTFLSMEYINHVNYSCTDGFVDLSLNFGLLAVHGTVLGRCNPHFKTVDTLTLKNDNSFERHWTIYEHFNCSGARAVYSKSYTQTATCSGNFKYMYQTSEVSHELFPDLKDKLFIMPQHELCYNRRQRILSFELHNETISKFDVNQCWDMFYYTILVEAVNLTIVQDSTLIGQKFESRDNQKCTGNPVKVEGWILNRCESLGDYFSTQMNWIDIGRHSGNIYVGYTMYNSYDCTGLPELTIYHHYGIPDICAHGAIVFSHSPQSVLSWSDWSFDSHMDDFSSQNCNENRVYHWATYNSRCVMKGNEKVEFDRCLRYNFYQDMDDDELNPFTSFQAYCHDNGNDKDDVCFHSTSIITYKGREFSYDELLRGDEPECSVPHSPMSKGVRILALCEDYSKNLTKKMLRVTDTHLVATSLGFKLAFSLKAGDRLYAGYDDVQKCSVLSVEKEMLSQQYFGLNCIHSEVLADGIRVSTFGDFHTLPSWYMNYVGSLLGPATASVIGEYISDAYYNNSPL